MVDFSMYKLGETDQLLEVDSRDDFTAMLLCMSEQAQQRILIFSHQLDNNLFGGEPLYEVVKKLAIKNSRTHVHILLQDPMPMIQKDHRLLRLSQRLSSHISMKICAKEHQDVFETFILFDDRAYITQDHPNRYEAKGNFHAPLKNRHLYEQFVTMWEQGVIDNNIRQLSL